MAMAGAGRHIVEFGQDANPRSHVFRNCSGFLPNEKYVASFLQRRFHTVSKQQNNLP
jgi:hypothetical protein